MFRRLLVPLDGSSFAASVIPVAMDLAARAEGEVHFVVVTPPVPDAYGAMPPLDPTFGEALRAENRRYLNGVLAREGQRGVRVGGEVLDGPVVETLADAARARGTDLMVLATHGRGGLSRLWLGSTAAGLIRRAGVPLLLLRPEEDQPLAPLRPRRILLPVEGSGFGEELIADALSLGGGDEAEVHLLEVVAPVPVVLSAASPAHDLEQFSAREAGAAAYLDRLREDLGGRAAACRAAVRIGEHVAREILQYAAEEGCDLVAMRTHGRAGMGRLLVGSVADKVIRGSHLPLLLRGPAA